MTINEERFNRAKIYEQHHYDVGVQHQNYFNWEYLEIDPKVTVRGKVIVELGAQGTSLIFGCMNFKRAMIVDPVILKEIDYFKYEYVGIEYIRAKAEDFIYPEDVDEVWVSNCLTHVQDPGLILNNIIKSNAKILRIVEPLNAGTDDGHPYSFNLDYFINKLKTGKVYKGGSRQGYHGADCYQGIIQLNTLR